MPLLPIYKDLTEEQKYDIINSTNLKYDLPNIYSNETLFSYYSEMLDGVFYVPLKEQKRIRFLKESKLNAPKSAQQSQKRLVPCLFKKDRHGKSYISHMSLPINRTGLSNIGLFGIKETSIYMSLSDNVCRHRSSGTQATASINKCFQVSKEYLPHGPSTIETISDYCSTCTMSTFPFHEQRKYIPEHLVNSKIYFFGRKKDTKQKGMGSKASQTRMQRTSQTSTHEMRTDKKRSRSNLQSSSNSSVRTSKKATPSQKPSLPPKSSRGAATTSCTSKSVTIKESKSQKPCPALGTTKGDMMATVSHIRIGPVETCPVHGSEPCQGPKCILASSGEDQGAVKVTSCNNPRRGVFEVVIRKLTGSPLAKNELMLEWTPPIPRPPPCPGICPIPCLPPGPNRPPKCKLIVCRPSPCKPKCCKKKPCGPIPCKRIPCKSPSCKKCCKAKCCRPCKPPPGCCLPLPCVPLCTINPCITGPCKSSPCLRPCPVGRRRPRKSRSQPKIKSHRKRISPCWNRLKTCPIVRSRSVPGPCVTCCSVPPLCLPRKCCSVLPCKPPKFCPSSCSTCCG